MSIIDLNCRITQNWDEYNNAIKSSKSLIHVNGDVLLDNVGPASMNLTVGNRWYNCAEKKYYQISDKGIKVKPGKSIIVETKQKIAVPYNVFGIIFGTGKNIFKGGHVSTGKINPGFHGELKIGYYNGGDSVIVFKPGNLLACCSFFEIERTLDSPLESYLKDPEPELAPNRWFEKIKIWFSDNWYSALCLFVSVLALFFSTK